MAVTADVFAMMTSSEWISLALTLLVVFLVYQYTSKSRTNQPPGPNNLPVLGSIPFFEDSDVRKAFTKMAKKYGNIFTVHLASQKAVVLNGYGVIKEALIKHGAIFAGRPEMFWGRAIGKGHGIAYTHGEGWQEQRRFVLRVLKDYGMSSNRMEDLIMHETTKLLTKFKSHVNKPYDPHPHLSMTTSNILTNVAFGRKFDYDDPMFAEIVHASDECFKSMGSDSLINIVPYLRHLPGDIIGFKSFLRSYDYLLSLMIRWIDEHKDALAHGDEPNDIVGSYLVEMKQRQDKLFSEVELKHVMVELFFGGIDTASTTIAWAILSMVNHPEIQAKVHQELDDVLGSDKSPSLADRINLPYTEAVIAETLRLYNVLPLSVPHAPLQDHKLGDYLLPKGTMIIINAYSVDMDPELWTNPDKFIPERHIDANGKFSKSELQIAFSLGKRVCPGESMARMELFLMFAAIMQQFQFSLPDGATKLDTEGNNVVTFQPKPYKTIMKLRK